MQVSAPAKINLSLRITGRRADGFHEIETLIAPISIADEITLEKSENGQGIQFQCDDPSIPPGAENLVVRAALAFSQKTNVSADVRIDLRKKIPHGAGLGGGSSDAASVLVGLNDLFETGLWRNVLAEIGARIGSDVPFFLFSSAAMCRGRGEMVSPEPLKGQLTALLLKPEFGVPTAFAYSRWQTSREIPEVSYAPQEFGGHRFFNDLERPVFEKYILLADMKTWLAEQPEVAGALMSGSGATVFAVLRHKEVAGALGDRIAAEFGANLWCCVCETVG
jgi:4-diphosphocytidyl-2-C-methyl-D-erythritol kinase